MRLSALSAPFPSPGAGRHDSGCGLFPRSQSWRPYSVDLHPVLERLPGYAQNPCSLGYRTALLQSFFYGSLLMVLELVAYGTPGYGGRGGNPPYSRRYVLELDGVARQKRQAAFDGMLKFSHVARPIVRQEG